MYQTPQPWLATPIPILALVAVRLVARNVTLFNGGDSPDAIFALGFVASQRLEMASRGRALLADARRLRP